MWYNFFTFEIKLPLCTMKDLVKLLLFIPLSVFVLACNSEEKLPEEPKDFQLVLNHTAVNITKGRTFQLSYTLFPEEASSLGVVWSTSNGAIATVDSNGLVTGVSIGEAAITAMLANGACSSSCIITVKEPSVYTITLSHTKSDIIITNYVTLVATVTPQLPGTMQLTWHSSNESVATVDHYGKVRGVGFGNALIYARLSDGSESDPCSITVYSASPYIYRYRLTLSDKGTSSFSVTRPEEFLSQRSINRRVRQGIAINETDLPISPEYLQAIEALGGTVVAKSKWLNTVCIQVYDKQFINEYTKLPFVQDAVLVWQGAKEAKNSAQKSDKFSSKVADIPNTGRSGVGVYGAAWENISPHKGNVLHEEGYKGNGIEIAVIDAGFNNISLVAYQGNIKIKGKKSFIYKDSNTDDNSHDHGVWVTSCMGYNRSGWYVGTAPEASYWLLRSEEAATEFPIEEDYWVAAMEYADSVGVDITNTSLGYEYFDYPAISYVYADSDGRTSPMSRAADMAAAKGIDIVTSAGNSASYVFTPGDAHNVLTIGSIQPNGLIAGSSSRGITADGRVKPDVVGLGQPACVVTESGNISYEGGTSFSSPIVCGMVACLRQAYPNLTTVELLEVMRAAADKAADPKPPYGWGVTDMQKAMQLAGQY